MAEEYAFEEAGRKPLKWVVSRFTLKGVGRQCHALLDEDTHGANRALEAEPDDEIELLPRTPRKASPDLASSMNIKSTCIPSSLFTPSRFRQTAAAAPPYAGVGIGEVLID